ncbi:MAG: hypothetical protein EA412_08465 [Chitinophagaceae bacterium]|nr:MAG: hypothetical protein EA412_08465 [Chitinophagaceae bacterium]
MSPDNYLFEDANDTAILSFDSARFSTNGHYALILKGKRLNGIKICYWNLYESGNNEAILDYIVIIQEKVFVITYLKNERIGTLTYKQNSHRFQWNYKQIYNLDDFLQEFDLFNVPSDDTENLIVKFDTIQTSRKIPDERSLNKIGDSISHIAYKINAKFHYNDSLFYTREILFLPDPSENMIFNFGAENNIYDYLNLIENQVLDKKHSGNQFGRLLLVLEDAYFLNFDIDSIIFSGYEIINVEGEYNVRSIGGRDPNSKITLLNKFNFTE